MVGRMRQRANNRNRERSRGVGSGLRDGFVNEFVNEGPGNVFDLLPVAELGGQHKEIFPVAEFLIELEGAKNGVEEFGVRGKGEGQGGARELVLEVFKEGGGAES